MKILPGILCIFFLLPFVSRAQQKDAVLYAGINVEKKITKQFTATLFSQCAFNENYQELGFYFFDAGLNYRFTRNLNIGCNYRLMQTRNLQNFYEPRQFFYGDVSFAKSKGDFGISLRSRYLVKTYGMHMSSEENYKANKHYVRNKATLRYELNKQNTLGVSEEQVFRLDTKNETEVWRTSVSLAHTFNLYNKIELSYAVFQQVNKAEPDTDFISGITYYFKF